MKTIQICKDCGCTESYNLKTGEQKRIKELTGKEQLLCWMGPSCGVCLCDVP
ncbi:MAG: hypothetical protein ACXAC6_15870 [Candidatus Hodarchaeales archaeon]